MLVVFDVRFFENGSFRYGCIVTHGDGSDTAQANESDGEHKCRYRHDENNEKFSFGGVFLTIFSPYAQSSSKKQENAFERGY